MGKLGAGSKASWGTSRPIIYTSRTLNIKLGRRHLSKSRQIPPDVRCFSSARVGPLGMRRRALVGVLSLAVPGGRVALLGETCFVGWVAWGHVCPGPCLLPPKARPCPGPSLCCCCHLPAALARVEWGHQSSFYRHLQGLGLLVWGSSCQMSFLKKRACVFYQYMKKYIINMSIGISILYIHNDL